MSRATVSNISARLAIVTAAIEAATTQKDRRLIAGKRPVAVVVSVPSAAWVSPVEAYFTEADHQKWKTFARDGSNRMRDKPAIGNSEVSQALSRGKSVVGIAETPDQILPSALMAAAEVTITIPPPSGSVVLDAIFRCLDASAASEKLDDEIVAGLEFDDFVAALRAGSTGAQAIKRLKSASSRRVAFQPTEKAPLLQTAVEYGEARTFGLSLARDLADYRAGRLPWASCQKGAIFVSEPGCGKSLLAASIASACKAPLIRASVPSFFNENGGHLGAVIQSITATFAFAAAAGPVAIILLDEIDALPSRANFSDSKTGKEWWGSVIAHLLCLLDSALGDGDQQGGPGSVTQRRPGIVVLGATNRIEDVDKAFLRPGRLERTIEIKRPDFAGTANILRYHLGQDLRGDDLTEVTQMLEGSTAAEIMDAVRGARRLARHARRDFSLADLRRQAVGTEEEAPEYLRRLAVHEACHAVIAVALNVGTLQRVSLRAQGTSGGQAWVRYDDKDLPTLKDFDDRATMVLAAGVGERIILGATSTGSSSDLTIATTMLAVAHASTGVTGSVFHLCSDEEALETARKDPALRRTVNAHLRHLEKRAETLVRGNVDAIRAVADALAKARHLSGEAVIAIIKRVGAKPPARLQRCAKP